MGLRSLLMGWDAAQQQLDRMQEAGHQAWIEQQSLLYPICTCTNCGSEGAIDDDYCGRCGTYLRRVEQRDDSWPSIDE